MAHIVEDRVAETSTTTGTGNFTLAGAITGFVAFDDVMANGDTCYYMIEAVDSGGTPTGEWETGLGTFNDTDTLVRTTVSRSSNAGAAVNFSAGTKRVALSANTAYLELISRQSFRGAMVKKTADQTGANYSAGAVIAWDGEIYDTDNIHDTVTNNSRLTVPAGVTRVSLGLNLRLTNMTAASSLTAILTKNGTTTWDGAACYADNPDSTNPRIHFNSGPLAVTAGDYFEIHLTCNDTSIDITASVSNFWMEVIEAATVDKSTSGTSFPVSPGNGDRFFRTDRGIEYFYDGTRWLSTELHHINIAISDGLMPTAATAAYKHRIGNPFSGDHDLYIEKVKTHAYQLAATTGSNYFSIAVIKARTTADGGDATLATHTTQNLAQNDWINQSTNINALAGINTAGFAMSLTETGTQNIYVNAEVTFRLVG